MIEVLEEKRKIVPEWFYMFAFGRPYKESYERLWLQSSKLIKAGSPYFKMNEILTKWRLFSDTVLELWSSLQMDHAHPLILNMQEWELSDFGNKAWMSLSVTWSCI